MARKKDPLQEYKELAEFIVTTKDRGWKVEHSQAAEFGDIHFSMRIGDDSSAHMTVFDTLKVVIGPLQGMEAPVAQRIQELKILSCVVRAEVELTAARFLLEQVNASGVKA